jgi:hypothetical protein
MIAHFRLNEPARVPREFRHQPGPSQQHPPQQVRHRKRSDCPSGCDELFLQIGRARTLYSHKGGVAFGLPYYHPSPRPSPVRGPARGRVRGRRQGLLRNQDVSSADLELPSPFREEPRAIFPVFEDHAVVIINRKMPARLQPMNIHHRDSNHFILQIVYPAKFHKLFD